MGLELAVDDGLGAVVELVEFPDRNEVDDLELQTCLRETALRPRRAREAILAYTRT